MTNLAKAAAFAAALLIGTAAACAAARPNPPRRVVEFESPLASPLPLQGYLRQPNSAGPSPAVVLLHSCNGNWARLDERWGKKIAAWGYVTLTRRQFWAARHQKYLQQRRAGRPRLRCLSGLELSGAAAVRRSRAYCGARIFARRLARARLGRARRDRENLQKQVPRGDRVLSALPWIQRQHDRPHPDPDRRARRLGPGAGVPQHGGRPRRLGNIPRQSARAFRSG